jgi:hypothetical protein
MQKQARQSEIRVREIQLERVKSGFPKIKAELAATVEQQIKQQKSRRQQLLGVPRSQRLEEVHRGRRKPGQADVLDRVCGSKDQRSNYLESYPTGQNIYQRETEVGGCFLSLKAREPVERGFLRVRHISRA